MKRTFVIAQAGDNQGWYISKVRTKSENTVFTTKPDRGTEVLALLEAKKVSVEEAYELFRDILTNHAIPFSDAKFEKNCTLKKIASGISINIVDFLTKMAEISDKKEETENEQKFGPLPRLEMCENCGKHGTIKGKGFSTAAILSKKMLAEAVAMLKMENLISEADAARILKQGGKSSLPEKFMGM